MKKIICCVVALVLCVVLSCTSVMAATFVPSIGDKGAPEVVNAWILYGDEEERLHEDCIVITPIREANTSTLIPPAARDELLDVYDKLNKGEMELNYDDLPENVKKEDMVIRDMFDISVICEEHADVLVNPENKLKVIFDVGVVAGAYVHVEYYKDGEWHAVKAVNNGDGTITCIFEEICPVAIAVPTKESPIAPPTGGNSGLVLWSVVAVLALGAIVALTLTYRRLAIRK